MIKLANERTEKRFHFVIRRINIRRNATQPAVKSREIGSENRDNQHNLYACGNVRSWATTRHREVSIRKKVPPSGFARIFARSKRKLTLSRSAERGAGHGARQRRRRRMQAHARAHNLAALPVPVPRLVLRPQPFLQVHDLLLQGARHRARARGTLHTATCFRTPGHANARLTGLAAPPSRTRYLTIFASLYTLSLFGSEHCAAGLHAFTGLPTAMKNSLECYSETKRLRVRLGRVTSYHPELVCTENTVYVRDAR